MLMEFVPAGTYDALEASARRIANPVHFVIERLTGGGWSNLGGDVPITPTYPVPVLFAERHFPDRPSDGKAEIQPR
jgi:hypothetical protein